jgi:hypothetical protein
MANMLSERRRRGFSAAIGISGRGGSVGEDAEPRFQASREHSWDGLWESDTAAAAAERWSLSSGSRMMRAPSSVPLTPDSHAQVLYDRPNLLNASAGAVSEYGSVSSGVAECNTGLSVEGVGPPPADFDAGVLDRDAYGSIALLSSVALPGDSDASVGGADSRVTSSSAAVRAARMRIAHAARALPLRAAAVCSGGAS